MSTDYGEKERAFLDTLKEDTGRDLAEWMTAIDGSGHVERNDIIDWLRQQGFMFSKASWIERIHHNGGKPIYAGKLVLKPAAVSKLTKQLETLATGQASPVAIAAALAEAPAPVLPQPAEPANPAASPVQPAPAAASLAQSAPAVPDEAALEPLLATAKAYRPLAQHILREICRAVPEARLAADGPHIAISTGQTFALLAISGRELRLLLNLAHASPQAPFKPARLWPPATRIPSGLTHMLVLTDARQVDEALLAAIRDAASAAN